MKLVSVMASRYRVALVSLLLGEAIICAVPKTSTAFDLQDELDKNMNRAAVIATRVEKAVAPVPGAPLSLIMIDPLYSADLDKQLVVVPERSIISCQIGAQIQDRVPATCTSIALPNGQSGRINATVEAEGEGIPLTQSTIPAGRYVTVQLDLP